VKNGFKFQSLGKISNNSTADPPVLLGQFQHCSYYRIAIAVFIAYYRTGYVNKLE